MTQLSLTVFSVQYLNKNPFNFYLSSLCRDTLILSRSSTDATLWGSSSPCLEHEKKRILRMACNMNELVHVHVVLTTLYFIQIYILNRILECIVEHYCKYFQFHPQESRDGSPIEEARPIQSIIFVCQNIQYHW